MMTDKSLECLCKGCRGTAELVRCTACNKLLIFGHYDSWSLDKYGDGIVCTSCAEYGVEVARTNHHGSTRADPGITETC